MQCHKADNVPFPKTESLCSGVRPLGKYSRSDQIIVILYILVQRVRLSTWSNLPPDVYICWEDPENFGSDVCWALVLTVDLPGQALSLQCFLWLCRISSTFLTCILLCRLTITLALKDFEVSQTLPSSFVSGSSDMCELTPVADTRAKETPSVQPVLWTRGVVILLPNKMCQTSLSLVFYSVWVFLSSLPLCAW